MKQRPHDGTKVADRPHDCQHLPPCCTVLAFSFCQHPTGVCNDMSVSILRQHRSQTVLTSIRIDDTISNIPKRRRLQHLTRALRYTVDCMKGAIELLIELKLLIATCEGPIEKSQGRRQLESYRLNRLKE